MKSEDRRVAALVRLTAEITTLKHRRAKLIEEVDADIATKEKRRAELEAELNRALQGAAVPKPTAPRPKRPPASQGTYAHLAFQKAIADCAETVRRMAVPVDKAMLAKELGIPEQAAYIRLFRAAKAKLLKQTGKGYYVPGKSDAPGAETPEAPNTPHSEEGKEVTRT